MRTYQIPIKPRQQLEIKKFYINPRDTSTIELETVIPKELRELAERRIHGRRLDQSKKTLAAQRLQGEEFALPKVEMVDLERNASKREIGLKTIQAQYNSAQPPLPDST